MLAENWDGSETHFQVFILLFFKAHTCVWVSIWAWACIHVVYAGTFSHYMYFGFCVVRVYCMVNHFTVFPVISLGGRWGPWHVSEPVNALWKGLSMQSRYPRTLMFSVLASRAVGMMCVNMFEVLAKALQVHALTFAPSGGKRGKGASAQGRAPP